MFCFLRWIEPAHAAEITLWGTSHYGPISNGDIKDMCSKQHDEFVNKVLRTSFLPFSYQSEQDVDDKIVRDYVALFMIVDDFIDIVRKSSSQFGEIQTYDFLKYQKIFYARIGFDESTGPYTEYVKKIRLRDSKTDYFRSFRDFDLLEKNINQLQNIQPYKLVTVNDSTLMNFVHLVGEIAQLYYSDKIKNNPYYDFKINIPNFSENNQSILDFAQPSYLFSSENFGSTEENRKHYKKAYNLVVLYWRDMFIAKNIIKLMNENSTNEFIVSFGEGHMAGVAKFLNESKELDSTEKNLIHVISMKTNPSLACNFTQLWANMFSKEVLIPLEEWYQNHGATSH